MIKGAFKKLIVLVAIVLLIGCSGILTPKYKFESEKGMQMSSDTTLPVFSDKGYSNEILTRIDPQEINVNSVVDGWREINIDGTYGWLPPRNIQYDNDDSVFIDILVTSQMPELNNGCEAVSTKMLLDKFGFEKDKLTIAREFPKDRTKLEKDEYDHIITWGDPDVGFVGSMKGKDEIGYSINPDPVVKYLRKYFQNPVNLTGVSMDILERYIRSGNPVVVWVTVGFRDVQSGVVWNTEDGKEIQATFDTHAMTLVGFDEYNYYLNDPFTGTKNLKVSKNRFYEVWSQLGNKAVLIE